MNEAETRAELIDPALTDAGWGVIEGSRIKREFICPGRILGQGIRQSPKWADYVLIYKNRKPVFSKILKKKILGVYLQI